MRQVIISFSFCPYSRVFSEHFTWKITAHYFLTGAANQKLNPF